MRLSCNNFKIRKFVEENCKTLSVCMWFFRSIYEVFFLLKFVLFKFLNDHPKKKKKKIRAATASLLYSICTCWMGYLSLFPCGLLAHIFELETWKGRSLLGWIFYCLLYDMVNGSHLFLEFIDRAWKFTRWLGYANMVKRVKIF